jgi:oligopeptide transport system substrate-binding protein
VRRLRTRRVATAAAALAAVMAVAACAGDDADESAADESAGEDGEDAAEAPQGGEVSVFITNPENLAPPSNVTESEGSEVLNALYSPLVEWDLETSEIVVGEDAPDAVAESVETEDNTTFTITLKEGWTFHNGDPVTAQSYIDSWNYGAVGSNANNGAYFFSGIAGYEDLQCGGEATEDEPCPEPPAAEEMSGLSVVDDQTFEVTLSEPNLFFPLVLGYTAFNPVPQAFFDDPEAFEAAPIGQGPFQVDADGWVQDGQVRVERYEDYPGTQPNLDSIEYRIYTDIDSAFNDALAGNLDIMDSVPSAQIESAEADFATFLDRESSIMQYLGFPTFDERFADPRVRQAFSLAVDRQAIADAVRPDFAPITGFVPASVPGAADDECGGNCPATGDPEAAAALLEEAGGWEGPLTLYFNAGADHDGWVEAVANQLRENLGIEDIEFQTLQFAEYLPVIESGDYDGPFRLGWVPDYPNPNTYLESLHATGGSSNYTGYSNPDFDALITEAKSAESAEDSLPLFIESQEILNEDMPIMPMFVARQVGIAGERVQGLDLTFQDDLDVFSLAVTDAE